MIHTTIGVYANGEYKVNGVPSESLATHLQYNIQMRPGRALFLDGKCIHLGYLDCAKAEEWQAKLKDVKLLVDTAPYV